jgi:hypothetical protein
MKNVCAVLPLLIIPVRADAVVTKEQVAMKKFGQGDGKPVFFCAYLSDGMPVDRGEAVRGEIISPRRN